MEKVLKVTKADGTIVVTPLGNKAFYNHLNSRILNATQQLKFEEISAKEAEKLPRIDDTFVTVKQAQAKVPELQSKIADLEAELAKLRDPGSASRPYAAEPPIVPANQSADEFTEQIKNNPEGNEAETNETIEKKAESKSKK
jgi:hypothetical protein